MVDQRHPRNLPRYRPVRTPLMSMGPSLEEERRRHRTARLVATASVVVVAAIVLLVWLVGLLGREVVSDGSGRSAAAADRTPGAQAVVQGSGSPAPQTLAEAVVDEGTAGLRLQLPIRREAITGIGYLPRDEAGVIELRPTGERANNSWLRRTTQRFLSTAPAGNLRWYRLEEGTPSMVIVGAQPGSEVYAPIDGKVVAITDYELSGEVRGSIIQLQPVGDAQTSVVLRNLDAASDLDVGTTVSRRVTRIGTVHDMSGVLEAPLATYTHDSGSGVDMYVLRADTASSVAG
ncbi:MAG: hypothetical protein JWM98_2795 [Thermoleophilia bacterium]|nr:hypothetical protein [Thermoleophilia bacterium]